MKTIAIIPARGGSKAIPRKNIKILNGSPLIFHTIKSVLETKIKRIIVSTDCHEIALTVKEYGIDVPFIRPLELAKDDTPTLPVIQHALNWLQSNDEFYDAVLLLEPTYPFRPEGFIDKAIDKFLQSGADSLISVLPVPQQFNPHWVFEPKEDGLLKISTGESTIIPRRQELPPAYIRDGALYITKTDVIFSKNSLYGDSITYIESNPAFYVNIDTMEDWEKAERLAEKLNRKEK